MSAAPSRRDRDASVALAGATGLVGQAILDGLLADTRVNAVHAIGRRRPATSHSKLVPHVVDFAAVPELPAVEEVYLAIGTTINDAGSEAAFRSVDLDANLAVARAALAAGARRCGLVSAMGADAGSRVFYSRVKGELEDAISGLGFEGVVIARPSLLVGERAALGQEPRPLERIGMVAGRALGPFIPANYRPIRAEDVARALLTVVPGAGGRVVLLSGAMQP